MTQLGAFSRLSVKLPALFAGGAAVSGGLVAFAIQQGTAVRLGALGLSSQQVEAALSGYDGALLVVSHDEDFLDAIGIERGIALG